MRGLSPALVLVCALTNLCCTPSVQPEPTRTPAATGSSSAAAANVIVSVVGTSDLHGHIERAPWFAGFLRNLRAARQADGAVVPVDAGDMWQGTIVSNAAEGAPVVRVFNALGYAAAAIGNHEFDYGPEGPPATPRSPTDDPRGALKARAKQARFPLLAANMLEAATGRPIDWPGVRPFTIVDVAGVRLGIVGVSTEETPNTTIGANVADLRMAPLAAAIATHASSLRDKHNVAAVIVVAHAGAHCARVDDPADLSSCDDGEVVRVARSMPAGLVDIIVGGHTHGAVAHRINGIAIIQSYALGRAFGRVDLTIDRATNRVTSSQIHRPRNLCETTAPGCEPGTYEGAPVQADDGIARLIADDMARAEQLRARKLGVRVNAKLVANHGAETALGNLLVDLMRAANAGSDVALINGGAIRADIPAGEVTYGAMYEAFPFDNRFAQGRVPARALAALIGASVQSDGGFISISGLRARASCEGGAVRVRLEREDGRVVREEESLVVVASDYQVMTKAFADAGMAGLFEIDGDRLIREALVQALEKRGGELDTADKALFDPARPRTQVAPERPLRCGQ
ncbi:MAG: 5'-nucleotidase C-terminal domain-containing protein [Polyangiaceae bacterium]|jgi:5'-nucleotidase|nr:5'-nucleotidase C-terminal domain-containing protein [Polyangiaceae bacterium]